MNHTACTGDVTILVIEKEKNHPQPIQRLRQVNAALTSHGDKLAALTSHAGFLLLWQQPFLAITFKTVRNKNDRTFYWCYS